MPRLHDNDSRARLTDLPRLHAHMDVASPTPVEYPSDPGPRPSQFSRLREIHRSLGNSALFCSIQRQQTPLIENSARIRVTACKLRFMFHTVKSMKTARVGAPRRQSFFLLVRSSKSDTLLPVFRFVQKELPAGKLSARTNPAVFAELRDLKLRVCNIRRNHLRMTHRRVPEKFELCIV